MGIFTMSKETCAVCGKEMVVDGGMSDHKCEKVPLELPNKFSEESFENWYRCSSEEARCSKLPKKKSEFMNWIQGHRPQKIS